MKDKRKTHNRHGISERRQKRNRHENMRRGDSKKAITIIGELTTTAKGVGFVDIPENKKSIYIERGNLNTGLNGDRVEVELLKAGGRTVGERAGRVTKVLERARSTFVGSISQKGEKFFVIADDNKMYVNISIDKVPEEVEVGSKVWVRFIDWSNPSSLPQGEIMKLIGKKGEHNAEMESIVLESGFESTFPKEVDAEAERIRSSFVNDAEKVAFKRKDMRKTLTFTIDPYDAKDFDDAISFRSLGPDESMSFGGQSELYEIGVHIADVSYFVRPGSKLDLEALKRGCSVYLVDRTIPMLPEALSNDICSLNPHEDKFAFSAVFVMDDRANVHSRWFGRTTINSDHRFTYETAQAVIDGDAKKVEAYSNNIQKAVTAEEAMVHRQTLTKLNQIAKALQKKKFKAGAIEFEQDEVKFRLDSTGKPVEVYKYERLDTHKLVEEYMLLANREVAEFITKSMKKMGRNAASIYRIHETPDRDRIKNLEAFAKALGYTLKTKDGVVTARDLNDLLDQIEDTPHEALIRTAAIRSMQKAVYSTKNLGHFGLAFEFYTHFTSPIRRYPDLLVHRILANHIEEGKMGDRDFQQFQNIAERSTMREIDAAEAERASKKLKQVEYMSDKIGMSFKGVISGVTKWGIYIEEKESKSEGLIPVRNLGQDYFNFDEKTYSMIGEKTKKRFRLGDEISFKVVSADLDRKQLEYSLEQ